ncbi:hypothetical protein TNCV_2098351 [Trichonephila clavipes]|nr:hypothetical protein TNCV_2098351 [Trichonephila clavipes]
MLKTQVGSCSISEKAHFCKCFPLCGICLQKFMAGLQFVWGTAGGIRRRILRKDDGGKPNRQVAASRALLVPKLLRTQSLPFRQQCRVHVLLSSMVVRLVLDPPTFQFPQNV